MAVITFGTGYDMEKGTLINEYLVPTPSYGSLGQTTSAVVTTARSASGSVKGSRVGKRNLSKLELKWSVLSAKEWSEICKHAKGATASSILFYVKYFDMEANDFKIRKMYAGDKKASPLRVDENGRVFMWKDCTLNLVDAGYNMGDVQG